MPALPPVPKAARLVVEGLINGIKPFVNSFHIGYSVGSPLTASGFVSIAATLASAWGSNLAPLLVDEVQLISSIVTALDSASAPEAINTTTHTGANAVQGVPAGTAFVVSREVARRYRGGHSRVYIPGFPAAALNDTETEWNPSDVTDYQNAWGNIEQACWEEFVTLGHTDANAINVSYYEGFTNF